MGPWGWGGAGVRTGAFLFLGRSQTAQKGLDPVYLWLRAAGLGVGDLVLLSPVSWAPRTDYAFWPCPMPPTLGSLVFHLGGWRGGCVLTDSGVSG